MSKSTEQSVKHKLKGISKTLGIPFNTLLEMLFLERFLVRIVKSTYADKLAYSLMQQSHRVLENLLK